MHLTDRLTFCIVSVSLFICSPFLGLGQANYPNATAARQKKAVVMPYNRTLQPAGKIIRYGSTDNENHALDAVLVPGAHLLVVEDHNGLAFIQTRQQKLISRFKLEDNAALRKFHGTYSGLKVLTAGDSILVYWSVANSGAGTSRVLETYWDGSTARIIRSFPIKKKSPAKNALPNEVVIHQENGQSYLYVVLNGSNELTKIRLRDGKTLWTAPTGVAPYGLAVADEKLYVTNWGGVVPDDTLSPTAGVPWGSAYIDPATGAVNNGSVSVIDCASGKTLSTIATGLHPNAIVLSPDKEWAFVACANSDEVFVINTKLNKVTDSISVRLSPVQDPFIGDSPDGLTLSEDGRILYVSNGMDNAVGIIGIDYTQKNNHPAVSATLRGFIPTEAYPAGLQADSRFLYVCNLEGEGSRVKTPKGYNSHHDLATVSIIPIPGPGKLKKYSRLVYKLNLLEKARLSLREPRQGMAPRPVPERIGEPSLFRHVIYIIKENRTYDQVLGDLKIGNGDPSICVFGDSVTPNEHLLAKDFLLLDNFFVSGKCSAEGHQWADAAMTTDYLERNVRVWFRSYPHVQNDALVYDKHGFIWNNALDHGKTVEIFGEAASPHFDNSLSWSDIYRDYTEGKPFVFHNTTTISRVEPLLSPDYPGFDNHKINDQIRADAFIKALRHYEELPGDPMPNLMILALPADHTAGTRPGFPTPAAMVADNDLALGRIIQAISQSRFWDSTAVFVTEDDSQDGWDHQSAYRTTAFVFSPYSRLHKTVHENYNQTSMMRTMEQILGIPPMNALDATATPMYACFDAHKDTSAYRFVPNLTPLDTLNKPINKLAGKARQMAIYSSEPQFDHIDGGNDDLLNKILWYATMGDKPYPMVHE